MGSIHVMYEDQSHASLPKNEFSQNAFSKISFPDMSFPKWIKQTNFNEEKTRKTTSEKVTCTDDADRSVSSSQYERTQFQLMISSPEPKYTKKT